MTWWIWILIGLTLLAGELFTPGGFVVIFFALAALLVGGLAAVGMAGPPWVQWALFSAISVISLTLFRKRLVERFQPHPALADKMGDLSGGTAILSEDLAPGATGKAEHRGTSWSVRHAGGAPLKKGQRCKIKTVEGLTLIVEAEPQQ